MKMFLSLLVVVTLFAGCALMPKPVVSMYNRPDLNTKMSKVIAFPLVDFNGKMASGVGTVDKAFMAKLSTLYGQSNVVPAQPILSALSDNKGFMGIIKSLDDTSAVEQLHKNPAVRDALAIVTSKLGNFNLALAIISGGESDFNAGKPVYFNMGYFDTENLTWRWITKTSITKSQLSNWTVQSTQMLDESFKEVQKANK